MKTLEQDIMKKDKSQQSGNRDHAVTATSRPAASMAAVAQPPQGAARRASFQQLPVTEAARICVACIRRLSGFTKEIDGQDALSIFFTDLIGMRDLADLIAKDTHDGLPSAQFKVKSLNSIVPSLSTTVSALEQLVVTNSVPV